MFNVSVIGGSHPDRKHYEMAYETGKLLAREKAIVICGGLTGVMEAVAKGAGEEGGISVGLLPGETVKQGNDFLTIKIPTGIGFARNFLVIRGGEVVIAIDGASGTMSELYFALSSGRTVLALGDVVYENVGHQNGHFIRCAEPEEAVAKAKKYAAEFRKNFVSETNFEG
ncbi:MAG: TIGR00725 family protein [Thermoplasmataceae archaeon]